MNITTGGDAMMGMGMGMGTPSIQLSGCGGASSISPLGQQGAGALLSSPHSIASPIPSSASSAAGSSTSRHHEAAHPPEDTKKKREIRLMKNR